jgi:N-acetylmuramoyl-L-alanine amidase
MSIIQKTSPNFDDRKGQKPSLIILHYTGMETAESALQRLTDKESGVSSHYTVDEDGTIYQHVGEEKRAWHAGVSSWQNMRDINAISIGIELVNPGHEFGYREFSVKQIEATKKLCLEIMGRYEIEDVLAHSDVAPDRKQDPGELFPWKELAQAGIGAWPVVSDEDVVKAIGINVSQALRDMGYDAVKGHNMLLAFQRHYVPEVFAKGTEGKICSLTKSRLYALLAGHLISP